MKPFLTFVRLAARDAAGVAAPRRSPQDHLLAAEQWLCRAQDASHDGGVSYGYSVKGGWRASYPETSGYIATTFLRLAEARDPAYRDRARRILDWLVRIQNEDGSFANPRYGQGGIVFDTGQILFGLVAGHEALGDPAYLAAARRAGDWLVKVADEQKRWTRSEHLGVPHVYNARTAWALLKLAAIDPDSARTAVARANLDWAVSEQQANGFVEHCSFSPGLAPFTHTIAYTARGLLEAGLLLGHQPYVDAALRVADAVLAHLRDDGFLPSTISVAGEAGSASCCLTGNCQFALVWLRLAQAGDRPDYVAAARRALDYVMAHQDIADGDDDVRGAIKGSHPIWGRYAPLSYPNWATKFFVDAMYLAQAPR